MPYLPEVFTSAESMPCWRPAPEALRLEPREIHVWRASLDDSHLLALAGGILSASEIVGAERCVNPAERDRELAMAAMLRDVLSRYVGVMPDELGFHRDARGRRTLSLSTLQFNASRAENMALIVVAPSGDVGVEVEQVRNDLPFDEMAAHFFEPEDEWNIRIAHAPALKASRFFDSWTGCEAFAQADSRVGSTPFLHRFCPADGFAAAVAVTDAEARPIFWNWR